MLYFRLIRKEVAYRFLTFFILTIVVAVSVGMIIVEIGLLKAHDLETDRILRVKEAQILRDMAEMEDDYRMLMLKLGLNMYILPEDQNMENFYNSGYGKSFMPEEYIQRLAESKVMAVRHLLPVIEQKIRWEELGNRTILLIGTRGEVKSEEQVLKNLMIVAVPENHIVLGYELWNSMGLSVAENVTFMGRDFTIHKIHSQRGTVDDITAWIDLAQAQELLGLQGKINGIMALQCVCPVGNDLDLLNQQIQSILPGTRVVFFENKVTIRAVARERAKKVAIASLQAEERHRFLMRREIEKNAAWLVPIVIVTSIIIVAFFTLKNVQTRRREIGIYCAIGFRSHQILLIFLIKALLFGVIGSFIGLVAGSVIVIVSTPDSSLTTLIRLPIFLAIFCIAPLLTALVSWIPALIGASADPAVMLTKE